MNLMIWSDPFGFPAYQIKFPNLLLLRQINLRSIVKDVDSVVEIKIIFA